MKKWMFILLTILLALSISTLAVCAETGDSDASGEKIEVIMALTATEKGLNFQPVKYFMEEVDKLIPGRIDWQVYFANALGGEEEIMTAILLKNIQATCLSDGAINMAAERWPGAELGNVPFLIPSLDAYYALLDDFLGDLIKEEYAKRGYEVLFFVCCSGNEIGNAVRPINSPADIKGLKIRAWAAEGPYRLLKALGAVPTIMSFNEVYTALQQNTIDGVITSDFQFNDQKFFEVTKYVTKAGMERNYFAFMFGKDWFDQQPEDVKNAFRTAGASAHAYARDVNAGVAEEETFSKLEENGVEISVWDDVAIAEAKQLLEVDYKYFRGTIGEDLFDRVVDFIDAYQSK